MQPHLFAPLLGGWPAAAAIVASTHDGCGAVVVVAVTVVAAAAGVAVGVDGGVPFRATVVAATAAAAAAAAVVAAAAAGAAVWMQSRAMARKLHSSDGDAGGGPVPVPCDRWQPPRDSPPEPVVQMCWCWPRGGPAGGATAAGGAADGPGAPYPSSSRASSRAHKTTPVRRLFLAAPGQSDWTP